MHKWEQLELFPKPARNGWDIADAEWREHKLAEQERTGYYEPIFMGD